MTTLSHELAHIVDKPTCVPNILQVNMLIFLNSGPDKYTIELLNILNYSLINFKIDAEPKASDVHFAGRLLIPEN